VRAFSPLWFGLWLAGCTPAGPPRPVEALAGEITVHEFPDWTHAWAAFVTTPVPLDQVSTGTLFHLPVESATLGACTVTLPPTCSPACAAGAFCAADHCLPLPDRHLTEGGPVEVAGGAGTVGAIHMAFAGGSGYYDSSPPPGPGLSFTGAEKLHFAFGGGGAIPNVSAALNAPDLLLVTDLASQPLSAITGGVVRWAPGPSELVEIVLSVASTVDSSRSVSLRCLALDDGELILPPAAMALLPPPPREAHLQVSRDSNRVVSLGDGRGVLVHAGYTVVADGIFP
jgi:hypothetical protein